MRLRIAVVFVLAGVAYANAQVNPANPNTPVTPLSLPSTFPQFQSYAQCLMNCDTRSATCQSTCSVSNSPTFTFATTPTGTRPDPGAVGQCYLTCTNQALVCKQSCTPPH